MQIENQRFLVTGGCGFIGSRVVRLLATRGAAVTVFDRVIRPEVCAGLPSDAADRVTLQAGDITNAAEVQAAASGAAGVFHLAVLDLNSCSDDPRLCVQINMEGTFTVLEAAQRAGLRKVVFSSASSVYGDTDETMDESHPLGARTIYGASKITGEYLCRSFHTMYGLDYVNLRYMNVYGPAPDDWRRPRGPAADSRRPGAHHLRPGHPIVRLHLRGRRGCRQPPRHGERRIRRGVQRGQRRGTLDQAGRRDAAGLTGSTLSPDYQPAPVGQMQRRVGSSAKAARLLDWRAAVPFDEGLRRVVAAG